VTAKVYLVDGYNVIRGDSRLRAAEQTGGLEGGREALLNAIRGSSLLTKSRVEVVFDGAAEGAASAPALHPGLGVRFSRSPQNADAAILALLGSRGDPEATAVVTADRELAWEAKKLGASILSPEAWLRSLSPPPRPAIRSKSESTKPQPTRAEVEWGLAAFGDEAVEVLPERRKTRSPAFAEAPAGDAPKKPKNNGENAETRRKERRRARHLRRTRG